MSYIPLFRTSALVTQVYPVPYSLCDKNLSDAILLVFRDVFWNLSPCDWIPATHSLIDLFKIESLFTTTVKYFPPYL